MPAQQEIFGSYKNDTGPMDLKVSITIQPSDLNGYLKRCGMTADYGAAFMSISLNHEENARNTLSFILNELVENAVKFSNSKEEKIDVTLSHKGDEIIFSVKNIINYNQYLYLKKYIQDYIDTSDINARYMELLSSMSERTNLSRIGLLTILNNFNAQIGIQIHGPDERELYHTSIQIAVKPGEII
jgi:hypothetical protein